MKYLYKTAFIIGLILIIELLKKGLDQWWPIASIFHHNLLACMQVLLLLWLLGALMLQFLFFSKTNNSHFNKWWTLCFTLFVLTAEIFTTYLLHHPQQIPQKLRLVSRDYYTLIQRNIIQYNPAFAVYDSALFYTLKPNTRFEYRNYEFADSFYTNQAGLRASNAALTAPEIICLGDSYTMGWGVAQKDCFAALVEKSTGRKTLNAGISSYGTVREMKLLEQTDTSQLTYIVLQYCRNDFVENKRYTIRNNQLPVSTRQEYDSVTAVHYWSKCYFPAKHFVTISKLQISTIIANRLKKRTHLPDTSYKEMQQEAANFLNVLQHSSINFKKVKLLLLDLNEPENNNNQFLHLVDSLQQAPVFKTRFGNNLITVPVAGLLEEADYYILDYQHPKASGHKKVAAQILKYLH